MVTRFSGVGCRGFSWSFGGVPGILRGLTSVGLLWLACGSRKCETKCVYLKTYGA